MAADREAVYRASAARAFENLGASDQEKIDRIVNLICQDPWIAPPLKTAYPMPPAIAVLYDDDEFWIVYHLPNNTTVDIWMIGRADADDIPPGSGQGRRSWRA